MTTIEQILLTIVFIGAPIAFSIGLGFYIVLSAKDRQQRNKQH